MSESIAASIPPELFENILAFVGNADSGDSIIDHYLFYCLPPPGPAARQEEIRHLSVCALTCVYWAQLTRKRIFRLLILRSSGDLSGLESLLCAPQSPRIPSISAILERLFVYYTLGDHPWFNHLTILKARHRMIYHLSLDLYITGPPTPAFIAAMSRGSILHPLSIAIPKPLPVPFTFPTCSCFTLHIENIHVHNPAVLSNLLQDCLLMRPRGIYCTNLTWDLDPVLQATPSSVGFKFAYRTECKSYMITVSGCTDDVFVTAILHSVPHRDPGREFQGPHLSPSDTSCLFDIIHATCNRSPARIHDMQMMDLAWNPELLRPELEDHFAVGLPPGTDFCLDWCVGDIVFSCIASPLLPVVRDITFIVIDILRFDNRKELGECMKMANTDWDAVLQSTIQRLPHLRQIVIKFPDAEDSTSGPYQMVVEFLSYLGEEWMGIGRLLGLYGWLRVCKYNGNDEYGWTRVELDAVMDEVKQRRDEIESEKAPSSFLEPGVEEECLVGELEQKREEPKSESEHTTSDDPEVELGVEDSEGYQSR